MTAKRCIVCGVEKDETEFYQPDKKRRPWYRRTECKECCNKKSANWYRKNPERGAQIKRNYYERNWEKILGGYSGDVAERHRSNARERYKSKRAEIIERHALFEKTHRTQVNANNKLRYHVDHGKIEKPDKCSACGTQGEVEAHHEDYSKPLDVEWLCIRCHKKKHGLVARRRNGQQPPKR